MRGFFRSWRRLCWPVCVAFVMAGGLLAGAAQAQQSDFSLQFASHSPGSATAMRLHIVYRDPANPNGKPSPIRHLVITAPQGTRINLGQPRCTASDQQIMVSGPGACPPDTQVGAGTLTAITGFGPPIDPFLTDVTIFNSGQGLIEIVRDHSSGATISDDRIQIEGNIFTGNPPATPGGPPDGQTAVRTIDFMIPASSGYITTPPRCPDGAWSSTASFTFADGSTQHAVSATPCATDAGDQAKPTTPQSIPSHRATPHHQRKHRPSRRTHRRRPKSSNPPRRPHDPDRDGDRD